MDELISSYCSPDEPTRHESSFNAVKKGSIDSSNYSSPFNFLFRFRSVGWTANRRRHPSQQNGFAADERRRSRSIARHTAARQRARQSAESETHCTTTLVKIEYIFFRFLLFSSWASNWTNVFEKNRFHTVWLETFSPFDCKTTHAPSRSRSAYWRCSRITDCHVVSQRRWSARKSRLESKKKKSIRYLFHCFTSKCHLFFVYVSKNLQSTFDDVRVQVLPQSVRQRFFAIFNAMFAEHYVVETRAMGSDFVYGVIQAIDGEKDPRSVKKGEKKYQSNIWRDGGALGSFFRNLLICFALLERLMTDNGSN